MGMMTMNKVDYSLLHIKLHEFFNNYLPLKRQASKATIATIRETFRSLREFFSKVKKVELVNLTMEHFTQSNIADYLVWLREERHNADSTCAVRLTGIKTFLKFTTIDNPELICFYKDVSEIRQRQPKQDFNKLGALTVEQLKLLIDAPDIKTSKGRRDKFFIILAYETGARIHELLKMKPADFIDSNGKIVLRIFGKGSKFRNVPVSDKLWKKVSKYLAEFHPNCIASTCNDLLFYIEHGDHKTALNQTTVNKMLQRYSAQLHAKHLDFPEKLHCHQLRHTIATVMYKNGIPISIIRDFLGHSSIDTTMIYAKSDTEDIAKAITKAAERTSNLAKSNGYKGLSEEEKLKQFCSL